MTKKTKMIEPFCVDSSNLTADEIRNLHKMCLDAGAVMLLATLVSNAHASLPMDEANLLMKPACVSTSNSENHSLTTMLDERKIKLDNTLFEARNTYAMLSEDSSTFEIERYEDLINLELALRGISAYLKSVWVEHSDTINKEHGKEVYDKFKYLVAKTGQLRKNISNILRVGAEVKGLVSIIEKTEFKPSEDFLSLLIKSHTKFTFTEKILSHGYNYRI